MSKTNQFQKLIESGKNKAIVQKNKFDISRLKSKQTDEKRKFGIMVYESMLAGNVNETDRLFKACEKKVEDINVAIDEKLSFKDNYNNRGIGRGLENYEVKEDLSNSQFRVDPRLLPSTKVEGYDSEIPTILVDLKRIIVEQDGYSADGIFRVSADSKERDIVKAKINRDDPSWKMVKDVHIVAKLLGEWFRELPIPMLDFIGQEIVMKSQNVEEVVEAHKSFSEPYGSIILWLWDFLVEVAEHSEKNRMSFRNLSIVFAPSLFDPEKFQNPMLAMEYSAKVGTFCERALTWRSRMKDKRPLAVSLD